VLAVDCAADGWCFLPPPHPARPSSKVIDLSQQLHDDLSAKLGIIDATTKMGYNLDEFFWTSARDAGQTSYYVVTDTDHRCVCFSFGYLSNTNQLQPTDERDAFALLAAPPAGVTSVDLLFSGFPAGIRNVPISG